jgi:hypothetical protein
MNVQGATVCLQPPAALYQLLSLLSQLASLLCVSIMLTVADIPADFDDESNPFQSWTKGDAPGKIRGFGIPAQIPRLNGLNFVVELRRCEIASIEVGIKG